MESSSRKLKGKDPQVDEMRAKWLAREGNIALSKGEMTKEQEYNCAELMGPVEVMFAKIINQWRVIAFSEIPAGGVIMAGKAHAIVSLQNTMLNIPETPTEEEWKWGIMDRLLDILDDMLDTHPKLFDVDSIPNNAFGLQDSENGRRQDRRSALRAILEYNVIFGANERNLHHPNLELSVEQAEGRRLSTGGGYWLLPTHIRHSCADANASVWIFGDFLIVRAYRDIKKGDEVFIDYSTLEMFKGGQERVAACNCHSCFLGRNETEESWKHRMALLDMTRAAVKDEPGKAELLILDIEALLPQHMDLHLELMELYYAIALANKEKGMYRKAATYFGKAFDLADHSRFAMMRIKLAIEVLKCYMALDDHYSALEWGQLFKKELTVSFGTDTVLDTLASAMEIDSRTMTKIKWLLMYDERAGNDKQIAILVSANDSNLENLFREVLEGSESARMMQT